VYIFVKNINSERELAVASTSQEDNRPSFEHRGPSKPRALEVVEYLPIPPFRAREFWTKWKIEHIRRLARSGRATNEPFLPSQERTRRILDRLYLRKSAGEGVDLSRVSTSVPLSADSEIKLSSPLYLGDMSFGALSGIPNIAIARAADATKIFAGTGEGGLLGEVSNSSRISVQWASARFGVDISTLSKGSAIVIKIGQGAKPGIGGHLPGVKVTEPISETRRIPVGQDAISPAPHHDIYSIEDLGQRILAFKEATGKPVFVKVGATNYIPYIASGVARMGGAGIIIDGAGAGTGAAPSIVKSNVGIPIELAVASADNVLRKEGLRDNFTIIAAGRVSCPEDSVKLISLGADITSLGTAALLALGCLMVHKCHLGYCPAVLTNKITPNLARVLSLGQSVQWLTNLVMGWTEEMKLLLNYVGVSDVRELRGRRDLLDYSSLLSDETVEIVGLRGSRKLEIGERSKRNWVEYLENQPSLWTSQRVSMLTEMAGTVGKTPGEAGISSMGSTSPPFVEDPSRICDWLVLDGAQVTRPSIDPYREEIEISTYLGGTKLRLSSPFFFTHLPEGVTESVVRIFERTSMSLGLLIDEENYGLRTRGYDERAITDVRSTYESRVRSVSLHSYLADGSTKRAVSKAKDEDSLVLLKIPSSRIEVERALDAIGSGGIFDGILIDEDARGSDTPLEISTSLLDRGLKAKGFRSRVNVIAEGNSVRGSDDVLKLVALGADCVGLGKAALVAIGFEEGDSEVVLDYQKSMQRLENFVIGMQREIKLLAGAAGVSCVGSTLSGNRELLRSLDLDPEIRRELGVKPAGGA
jgi:glutamate synthase domain-containing protein 2